MSFQESYKTHLSDLASKIGANIEELKDLIQIESAWSPQAYNKSGAIGLIQFMPVTLKRLGLLSLEVAQLVPNAYDVSIPENVKQLVRQDFLSKYPDVISQLQGPVLKYLYPMKPFPNRQNLYMAVFYPSFRSVPITTVFPEKYRKANPGVDTVADYMGLLEKKKLKQHLA